jgi:CRP/FNR family cyclic AMP-dependent transcriptional regulator
MLDKAQLANFEVFSGLDTAKLAAIAKAGELKEFKENDIIFREDEAADRLYGVLDGEVELSIVFKDKILKAVPLKDIKYEEENLSKIEVMERPIVVDSITAGEVFGWSSAVSPGMRTATARCTRASKVISIPGSDLKRICDKDPVLGYAIMGKLSEVISRRLQKRTDTLVEAWGQAFGVDRT